MREDEYLVFHAEQIGVSHIEKGMPCEDRSASYFDDSIAIAVVSDGHGDKNCFRSGKGAEIACAVAIAETRGTLCRKEALDELREHPDRQIGELERHIADCWKQAVARDLEENPVSEEELRRLDSTVAVLFRFEDRQGREGTKKPEEGRRASRLQKYEAVQTPEMHVSEAVQTSELQEAEAVEAAEMHVSETVPTLELQEAEASQTAELQGTELEEPETAHTLELEESETVQITKLQELEAVQTTELQGTELEKSETIQISGGIQIPKTVMEYERSHRQEESYRQIETHLESRRNRIYGCTLLMAVVVENFWFGIHVGDGRCVCVYENGWYGQPIPWDELGCVGNRTTSLCDRDAAEKFRHAYGREIPVAIFVASDGVDESFDESGLNKCYYTLGSWLRNLSPEESRNRAEELLERISRGGSGDDVSVACIISRNRELLQPFSTSRQVADKMEELYIVLKDAEKRNTELTGKKRILTGELQKIQEQIKKLETELEEKRTVRIRLEEELNGLENSYKELQEQTASLIERFEEAKRIKRKVDAYWSKLGGEICENPEVMEYEPGLGAGVK